MATQYAQEVVINASEFLRKSFTQENLKAGAQWLLQVLRKGSDSALTYVLEIDYNSSTSQALMTGIALGVGLIILMKWFPGEPFDYEEDLNRLQSSYEEQKMPTAEDEVEELLQSSASTSRIKVSKEEALEIEKAASQVRIDKLQEMLGLERQEIEALVEKAREDALAGKRPTPPPNYMQRFDMAFYIIMIGLLMYCAHRDYGINFLQIFERLFPAESRTLQDLRILPQRHSASSSTI